MLLADAAIYIVGMIIGTRKDEEFNKQLARNTVANSKEGQQIERLRRELEEIGLKLEEKRGRAADDADNQPPELTGC